MSVPVAEIPDWAKKKAPHYENYLIIEGFRPGVTEDKESTSWSFSIPLQGYVDESILSSHMDDFLAIVAKGFITKYTYSSKKTMEVESK